MPHALPPGEDVQLSKDRFLVGTIRYRIDIGWEPWTSIKKVRVVSGLTGTAVCTCRLTEKMTRPELMNCLTTVAAMLLNVPRISITIKCRRQTDSWEEAVAAVVINKMSSWIEPHHALYDVRFDSNLLDERTYFNDGLYPCLICGDPTVDIDFFGKGGGYGDRKRKYLPWDLLKLEPDLSRDDLCARCNPCAACENCRFDVDGEPVCMACLEDSEVAALPASAQRRHGVLDERTEEQKKPPTAQADERNLPPHKRTV